MNLFDSLKMVGFDHVEFAVDDLDEFVRLHERLGFSRVGTRTIRERQLTSVALAQGNARIVLSQSQSSQDPLSLFIKAHGSGIFNVAFFCQNAHSAFEQTLNRGAEAFSSPKLLQKDFGRLETASIRAFGDVIHTFISREGAFFLEGFETPIDKAPSGLGVTEIDHITSNVEKGKLEQWALWYQKIFGFEVTRFFDIQTERTGLLSKVMESPNHLLKMPLNEPTSPKSQIQEFLDINHGPGIQHLALLTHDILRTVPDLHQAQLQFLEGPPRTYYESVPSRVSGVKENLEELQKNSILIDGDASGYLLQIFTQNLIGPFFYEIIQRCGNQGFGEGNFGALFEAIERDQIRRGVL